MNLAIDTFPQERFGLVTGSRCSSLVPKRSAEVGQRSLARKLAKERVFEFHDERGTWQTEHGKMAEVFAFEHYEKYFDNQIQRGRWIANGDIGGSTDAEAEAYGVDFKCPTSLEVWLEYLEGIDDDQYNQAQLYMILTGKNKWLVAAYLIEHQFMTDNGLVYPIEESKRMILNEVEKSDEWAEKFFSNLPKVVELRDQYVELYKTRK